MSARHEYEFVENYRNLRITLEELRIVKVELHLSGSFPKRSGWTEPGFSQITELSFLACSSWIDGG